MRSHQALGRRAAHAEPAPAAAASAAALARRAPAAVAGPVRFPASLADAPDALAGRADGASRAVAPVAAVRAAHGEDQHQGRMHRQVGLRRKQYCDFEDGNGYGSCAVMGCSKGRCSLCPSFIDISAFINKGWCTYTCVRDKQIVGIKMIWYVFIDKKIEECMLLEHPVPFE
ncbi:hypothetical protein [Sorangium sp. So ce363]|uniref:hypothetical protein n=1 Tax=Sorangium sp. So ce363 TaxID=3133304 RepID=UPI003F61173F